MSENIRTVEILCKPSEDNITVGQLLRRRGFSGRILVMLKRIQDGIMLKGSPCRTVDRICAGDVLTVKIPERTDRLHMISPCFARVEKVYEDDDLIIYNKPCQMAVHESAGNRGNTLANVFAAEYPSRPFRAVNRLDKDTSGLCLAAKNRLGSNIPAEKIDKVYYAVCEGIIDKPLKITAPIGRQEDSIIKRTVRADGQYSETDIFPLYNNGKYTFLEISLHTGRTHQIRVHLSYAGHPLAGDTLYGGSCGDISRQALHCGKMRFIHPVSGREIFVSADLPEDMKKMIGNYLTR